MRSISAFYCLLYATLTEAAAINLEGLEGGDVSFQCSHKLASTNSKYFCRDPCKTKEDELVSVESGGRSESGKITLVDSGDGVFTVTFTHLQLSDSGRYWCAVRRSIANTFTEVHLTVNEAVAHDATTVLPDVFPTSQYWNSSNSTHFPSHMETDSSQSPGRNSDVPSNLTALNCTDGGTSGFNKGAVLYATAGVGATLVTLVLAVSFREWRKKHKPQQLWSNSADFTGERQFVHESQSIKGIPEMYSCIQQSTQDPPTSACRAFECSSNFGIYENI